VFFLEYWKIGKRTREFSGAPEIRLVPHPGISATMDRLDARFPILPVIEEKHRIEIACRSRRVNRNLADRSGRNSCPVSSDHGDTMAG